MSQKKWFFFLKASLKDDDHLTRPFQDIEMFLLTHNLLDLENEKPVRCPASGSTECGHQIRKILGLSSLCRDSRIQTVIISSEMEDRALLIGPFLINCTLKKTL